jgi:hypothetical protein
MGYCLHENGKELQVLPRIILYVSFRISTLPELLSYPIVLQPSYIMSSSDQRQINWRNFYICFLISLGLIAFGYPSAIISTTLGEPSFLLYMGLLDSTTLELTENADGLIGAMSGVFQVRKRSAKGSKLTQSRLEHSLAP